MVARTDAKSRSKWLRARIAERRYATRLRQLARHIAELLRETVGEPAKLVEALERYAEVVTPWASSVAARMLSEVSQRDARTWEEVSREMGFKIKREILHAPTGQVMRRLQQEQVQLITSLPLEAAKKAQELAASSRWTGARPEELKHQIVELGNITMNRARLIARTESAKASSTLTQARAQYIGSEGYIWRTADDENVRLTHQKMEGKYIRWDSPPTVDPGVQPYHAGCIYNCRCYPEPIVPRFRAE